MVDQDVTTSEEIGYLETSVGNIMGARQSTLTADLKYDKSKGKRGQIIIRAEAVNETNHTVVFQLAADGINNKVGGCLGMCGEPGPVSYEI